MSQGTLIGIDQLALGSTAACDLLDLSGRVAIPTGTPITPQLLSRIKAAGVVGLVAGRPDFASHHVAMRRPSMEAIGARISEMRRRSGIADPLTPSTRNLAQRTLSKAFSALAGGGLPDLTALKGPVKRILHDIELLNTAPIPSPRRDHDTLVDRLVDGGIDIAVLLGWHLRRAGWDGERVHEAVLGGLLHDVGLLHIPSSILWRSSALSRSEYRQIRRHPYLGLRALSPLGAALPECAQAVTLLHHEREDGRGYPLGRAGEAIPLVARLAHILDAYAALVSPRPHRLPYSPHRAIEILLRDSGKSFNRTALREFVKRTGRYPLGSAVVLSTNEIGVVVGQGNGGPFRPVIDVYFSRHHQFTLTPRRVDLSQERIKYVRQVMR